MARTMEFTKMEGLGNDYVYVDARRFPVEDPVALSIRVSDRHTGIGSDGLILIDGSAVADFRMRIFNADGSEARMCGNGARCVGKYVYDKGLTARTELTLETGAGIRTLRLEPGADGKISSVTVDMGPYAVDGSLQIVEAEGRVFAGTAVSVGNPHFVVFGDGDFPDEIARYGRALECHPLFPDRANVEFACLVAPGLIRMRVWERGSGMTMACGTGACATAVAATLKGLVSGECIVRMDGGDLRVLCDTEAGRVRMTGPAHTVFEGKMEVA